MARGGREGVMIVMPSFSIRNQRHPPIIGGEIVAGEILVPPEMGRRIHEPRNVISRDQADAHSPHYPGPSTREIEANRDQNCDDVIDRFQPAVETLLVEIGSIAPCNSLHLFTLRDIEHPEHVAPPETFGGGVRIARSIA